MTLEDALERAAERYPPKDGCDWNIVMSNYRRRKVNKERQAVAASQHVGTKVRIDGEVSFQCFVGTKLIGRNSALQGIVNGAFLLVTAIQDDKITLLDEDLGVQADFTAAQLAKHTRLRWALTLCSVQGRSLPGSIAIHNTRSRHFDVRHLYVALSRATDGANVHIVG